VRVIAASLFACLVVAASGCGNQGDESTPVACLEGAAVYEKALRAAPDEVLLDGETPISDCLTRNQNAADLTRVGEAMVEAAGSLNTLDRIKSYSGIAVRIGYLLGAAERGAEDTEGIHADLLRRLTVAARYTPGNQPLSQRFLTAYREGFDAGHSSG